MQQIPPSLHVMVLQHHCDHSITEGHLNFCLLISFLSLQVLLTLTFDGGKKERSLSGKHADRGSARQTQSRNVGVSKQ